MPGFQSRFGMPMPMGGYRPGPSRFSGGGGDEEPNLNSEQFRKLFIGGLSFESDEESLKDYFSKWGEIADCIVIRDQQSKRSRGFGFITFKDNESLEAVQKERPHKVDSREVETKRAMPRDDPSVNNQAGVKKVFVGGLKDDTTEDMVREIFGEFGIIETVELITDKTTGKIKGFCFITFEDYDSADKCVLRRRVVLNQRKVEVKKALSKGDMDSRMGPPGGGRMANMGMGPMGPMGPMGRGGRGDFGGGYGRDFDRGFGGGFNNYGGYQGGFGGPGYWQGYNDYGNNYQGNSRGYGGNNYGGGNYGGSGGFNRR